MFAMIIIVPKFVNRLVLLAMVANLALPFGVE